MSKKTASNNHKTEADLDKAIAAELGAVPKLGGEPPMTMASQMRKHRDNYVATSTNNRLSLDNGDDVATLLRGSSPEGVVAAAEVLCGMATGELAAKYERLNNGQRRMNAGNRIRGLLKKGAKTTADVAAALAA